MNIPTFNPLGTARRAFELAQGTAALEHEERFTQQLLASKGGRALGDALIHVAYATASLETTLKAEHRDDLTRLILASMAHAENGSTRLPITGQDGEQLENILRSFIPDDPKSAGPASATPWADSIRALLASGAAAELVARDPAAYRPFIYADHCFYQHRQLSGEIQFAESARALIQRRMAAPDDADLHAAFSRVLDLPAHENGDAKAAPVELDAAQQYALLSAAVAPLTVISGGPGTGKTTLIVSLLRVLKRLNVDMRQVALAAPTGKAAYRMAESVQAGMRRIPHPDAEDTALLAEPPKPQTLHRLLGYSPSTGRFYHHPNHTLAARVVIVDEASMVDLDLMHRLLRALDAQTRLVLIGDADQLPSVEAGAVLRDLLPETFAPRAPWFKWVRGELTQEKAGGHILDGHAVRLARNFRLDARRPEARAMAAAAAAVQAGLADDLIGQDNIQEPLTKRRTSATDITFNGIEWMPQGTLASFLDRWIEARINSLPELNTLTERIYEAVADGFLPEDTGLLGKLFKHYESARLLCVTRILPTGSEAVNAYARGALSLNAARGSFGSGEPVMVLRNDYENRLFNGDQGIVLRVRPKGRAERLMAVFPREGSYVPHALAALHGGLETAYAITVHKSQGSEFEHAALILPTDDVRTLSREIVYTAITRAKKSVTIWGPEAVLNSALARPAERYSGIRERLRNQSSVSNPASSV